MAEKGVLKRCNAILGMENMKGKINNKMYDNYISIVYMVK